MIGRSAPALHGQDFFERDPQLTLLRRATAEAAGTFLLVFTVAASAIAASSLAPGVAGIARALAMGPTLTALILAFGPISGGHFNPLITLAQWMTRQRPTSCLAAYIVAQLLGATMGAQLAFAAFASHPLTTAMASLLSQTVAEFIAAFGLMILVMSAPRMQPRGVGPFAVGGWIAMTLAGLPTSPAANPAISLGLLMGAPALVSGARAVLAHVGLQFFGMAAAMLLLSLIDPGPEASSKRADSGELSGEQHGV